MVGFSKNGHFFQKKTNCVCILTALLRLRWNKRVCLPIYMAYSRSANSRLDNVITVLRHSPTDLLAFSRLYFSSTIIQGNVADLILTYYQFTSFSSTLTFKL